MISQSIKLSLIPGGISSIINISENDVGSRDLVFNLKQAASGSVTIEGKFVDGTGFSEACTMANNVVSVTITSSMTACYGDAICNLCFKDGNNVLRSENFILKIQRRPR